MTTLPHNLVLRLVADTLDTRYRRLRERVENNPRPAAASKTAGRRQAIAQLEATIRAVRALRAEGNVSAEVAGLLIAWAAGHMPAVSHLDRLEPRVEELDPWDIVEACRVLLGAR